jgi:uncharacterized protein DUF3891
MVFRIATTDPHPKRLPAWEAFAPTQQVGDAIGYISQPAHAALAGVLAANLSPDSFGLLPAEMIDAISKHDIGWAAFDLKVLEQAAERRPKSFVECETHEGVSAWKRSICESRARSTLAGIVTSRHFCLLAPRDGDVFHQEFVRAESGKRQEIESITNFATEDLDRYTAALGFCDLLSLCLCSGLSGTYALPLAHPADPASSNGKQLGFTISDSSVRCERRIFLQKFHASVAGWFRTQDDSIAAHRFDWEVE